MNKTTTTEVGTNFIKASAKSLIYSMSFTFISFVILALIMTLTTLGESFAYKSVLIITILSVLLSGFLRAKSAVSRGWMWGALGGILYTTVLWITSIIFNGNFSFGLKAIISILISALTGAAGGIIGINFKRKI